MTRHGIGKGERGSIELRLKPSGQVVKGAGFWPWSPNWRHHPATQLTNDPFPYRRLGTNGVEIERIQGQSQRPKLAHQG